MFLQERYRMGSKHDPSNYTMSEPEAETTATIPSHRAIGEPLPEWSSAIRSWGSTWLVYQYGFGAAFGILALLTLIFLLRSLKISRATRPKKAALHVLVLLFLFSLSRSLFLSVDAYSTKMIFPQMLSHILWSLGNPCIVTAYVLVFLVLKNIFFMKERFKKWYTTRNIAFVTIPYFTLVFVTELVVHYIPNFIGLTFTCQMAFVVLSFIATTFYSIIAFMLWKNLKGKQSYKGKERRHQLAWVDKNKAHRQRTLSLLKLCLATVLGGFSLSALQIYSMSGVYGVFSKASYVEAWPWLIFNYAMRALEWYLAFLLYFATTRGSRNTGGQRASFSITLDIHNLKPIPGSRKPSRKLSLLNAHPRTVAHADVF